MIEVGIEWNAVPGALDLTFECHPAKFCSRNSVVLKL